MQEKYRDVGDLRDRSLSKPVEEDWTFRQTADRRAIGERERERAVDAERRKRHDDDRHFDDLRDEAVDQAAGDARQQSGGDGRGQPDGRSFRISAVTTAESPKTEPTEMSISPAISVKPNADRQEAEESDVLQDAGEIVDRSGNRGCSAPRR